MKMTQSGSSNICRYYWRHVKYTEVHLHEKRSGTRKAYE
jgi:hypothetical protein